MTKLTRADVAMNNIIETTLDMGVKTKTGERAIRELMLFYTWRANFLNVKASLLLKKIESNDHL